MEMTANGRLDLLEEGRFRSGEWDDYLGFTGMAQRADESGRPERARSYKDQATELREGWFAAGIVDRGRLGSPGVLHAIALREEGTRRYDPIRLTVQHDAFTREHIDEAMSRHAAVDVMDPDITLTDVVNDPERRARYQAATGNLLEHLGVERLVIVQGLPICEFSFGYSRVSSTPVYKREYQGQSIDMPVRLKAFDQLPIQGTKRPIYVTQQRNEALYFKLEEARVIRWLKANGVSDVPDKAVGRVFLERYEDFGPFLEIFKDREGLADIRGPSRPTSTSSSTHYRTR